MTKKKWARLAVAGALTAALAGCTASEEPPDEPAAPTASSTDSESPTDEAQPPVDVPPADDLAQAFTVPVPAAGRADSIDMLGPVFAEDLVLFTDDHDFLHAVDRATGQERWRVKRRSATKGGDTPCALALPTPDAEVVVMNHGNGSLCGNFTVYSLADGSVTETYDFVPEAGREINFDLESNSDLVVVEGLTYFLDADHNLLRLEADGTTSIVGDPIALVDSDEDWSTGGLMVLPGSDVIVTRLFPRDGDVEFDEDEDGKLIGLRVGDSDQLELVWEQDVSQLMSEASSPGHVFGQLEVDDDVPGMIVDLQRSKGRELTRYRVLDPETGELANPGYTFVRNNPTVLPGFVDPVVPGQSLRSGTDSTIFTPVTVRGRSSPTFVRRLDLASGDAVWSWAVPGAARASQTDVQVVSSSADERLVYVRTSVDVVNRLWELDGATGEPVRNWQFSLDVPEALDLATATVSIDDGDVFQMSRSTTIADVMAALYR